MRLDSRTPEANSYTVRLDGVVVPIRDIIVADNTLDYVITVVRDKEGNVEFHPDTYMARTKARFGRVWIEQDVSMLPIWHRDHPNSKR